MVSDRVVQRGRQHPPKKVEKLPLNFQGQTASERAVRTPGSGPSGPTSARARTSRARRRPPRPTKAPPDRSRRSAERGRGGPPQAGAARRCIPPKPSRPRTPVPRSTRLAGSGTLASSGTKAMSRTPAPPVVPTPPPQPPAPRTRRWGPRSRRTRLVQTGSSPGRRPRRRRRCETVARTARVPPHCD